MNAWNDAGGDLGAVLDRLRQEASEIQVQGRALSAEEWARLEAIERVLPLLDEAIAILAGASGRTADPDLATELPGEDPLPDYGSYPEDREKASSSLPGDDPIGDYSGHEKLGA